MLTCDSFGWEYLLRSFSVLLIDTILTCWWWSSENKWSPSRCPMAWINESRFCLEFDWDVQTEILAGALGNLGTLGVPLETFCTLGTMQTSGVNLK